MFQILSFYLSFTHSTTHYFKCENKKIMYKMWIINKWILLIKYAITIRTYEYYTYNTNRSCRCPFVNQPDNLWLWMKNPSKPYARLLTIKYDASSLRKTKGIILILILECNKYMNTLRDISSLCIFLASLNLLLFFFFYQSFQIWTWHWMVYEE